MGGIKKKRKYTKKNKTNKLVCGYCKFFFTATDRCINEVEGKEKNSRYCVKTDLRILTTSFICEHFVLHKYFFCNKAEYRIAVEACINKEKCKYSNIKKCIQREILEEAFSVSS